MTAIDAKADGYDKNKEFLSYINLVKDSFIANYFKKKLREQVDFEEDAAKTRMIKFIIKDYRIEKGKRVKLSATELEAEFQKKIHEAENVIAELEKGNKFEELARKYSNDFSKRKGGDIGYVIRGMREPQFISTVFSLKDDEYTKKPVRIGSGVYIIKVEKRQKLTNENIMDVIENEAKAKSLQRRLQSNIARSLESKLISAPDVVDAIDKVSMRNERNVMFKIGEEQYRVKNLNELIEQIYKSRMSAVGKIPDFDDDKKKKIAKSLFVSKVMKREALKRGVEKEKEFEKQWNMQYEVMLSNMYIRQIASAGVEVTKEEIKKEYDKNRNKLYVKKVKKGGKIVKKSRPFSEVKDSIKSKLIRKKMSENKRTWEKELLAKYNYKVIEDELEVKE